MQPIIKISMILIILILVSGCVNYKAIVDFVKKTHTTIKEGIEENKEKINEKIENRLEDLNLTEYERVR